MTIALALNANQCREHDNLSSCAVIRLQRGLAEIRGVNTAVGQFRALPL